MKQLINRCALTLTALAGLGLSDRRRLRHPVTSATPPAAA